MNRVVVSSAHLCFPGTAPNNIFVAIETEKSKMELLRTRRNREINGPTPNAVAIVSFLNNENAYSVSSLPAS